MVGVAIEVIFVIWEYEEDLHDFRGGVVHPPDKPSIFLLILGLFSASLVAVSVAGELLEEARIERVETQIRQANDELYLLLSNEAGDAATSAKKAHDEADKAATASSNASTLASGARTEADSFKQQITDAKQQAANAVSRLAEAENKLADATQRELAAEAEVHRLRTPRSLVDTDKLVAALKPFSSTEYVLNVFMDDEAIQFSKDVAGALDAAGWIRKQPTSISIGIPTMKVVLGQGPAENVPACLDTGISLRAHVKESLAVLQSTPVSLLPKTVQAAIALKSAIAPSISPGGDERNVAADGIIDPELGEGPLTICIGKKP